MKIAFILNCLSGGGIARVVATYANALAKDSRHQICLVLLHKMEHFYEIDGRVSIIENPYLRKNLSKMEYALRTFFFLREKLAKSRFDRVISNGEWINSFVYLSSFGITPGLFFADHCNPQRMKQSPFAWLDKWTYKRVAGVLVLSEAARQKIIQRYCQKNVHLLKNPVELLKPVNIGKENVIISMGRLSPEKGQDILLKAFALIDCNWLLYILGEGEMRGKLEALAQHLGIESRVKFWGNQKDIAYYLSKSKIFVLPSHTENFPMALLEAMSIGLPCVVTDCMAWRASDDFIRDGENGIKVPVDNPQALAEGLKRLIESDQLQKKYSSESLKIREKFDLSQMIKELKVALEVS